MAQIGINVRLFLLLPVFIWLYSCSRNTNIWGWGGGEQNSGTNKSRLWLAKKIREDEEQRSDCRGQRSPLCLVGM